VAMLTENATAAVPALLTLAAVQAAMRKTSEAITANVAALTEEGIKAMGATKTKTGLALMLMVGMAAAVSAFGYQLAAVGEPADETPKAAAILEQFQLLHQHLPLPTGLLMISDRGTYSPEHVSRLHRHGRGPAAQGLFDHADAVAELPLQHAGPALPERVAGPVVRVITPGE